MPTIDQLTDKAKKKFVKSDYRPWNYMEEIEKESNGDQLGINEAYVDVEPSSPAVEESYLDINEISIGDQEKPNVTDNISKQVFAPALESKIHIEKNQIYSDQNTQESALDTIFRLAGYQKKIFMLIIEKCVSRGMLSTGGITIETFVEKTGTTSKMIKTSINRLIGKNLIHRERGKTGRGGFYLFSVTEQIRNAALDYKRMAGYENHLEINKESIGYQKEIKQESTVNDNKHNLPDAWLKINIHPLEEIGFKQHHLFNIYETQLSTPGIVQDSILHFAYGMEHEAEKYKKYPDLLNVFIGCLRKGKPWFEQNYRSPQEIAQAQLIESRRSAAERMKKLEDEAFKLAMSDWQAELGENELATITKKNGVSDIMPAGAKISIYFKENIWPEKKKHYLLEESVP